MANTGFLDVSEISFDGIKSNLKSFLQAKTEFQDYDFEGSNLNALLDILSYNTYMNSFYLNMVGSEMFLDSAQIRNSVISHAKELNYLPRSRTSAKAKVTFSINTGTALPGYVVIPENYTIKTTVDNTTLDFSTDESIVVLNNGGTYQSDPIYVYEGKNVTEYFTVNGSTRYILNSDNADTNSIKVTVIKSSTDSSNSVYNFAENLYGLNSNSEVYFLQGYAANQYEVVFGDGISGKALANGNIVKVKYRSTNGELGNKASSFTSSTKIDGLYNVTVTTNIAAVDGSERETVEAIKLNAPRHFTSQNRAVTKEDYTNLIVGNYPQIKTVNIYGGEDANPPQYGKVIISMIPYGTSPLVSTELKNDIVSFLNDKNITTKPVVVDPEYLYVEITSDVRYNPSLTSKTATQIKSDVVTKIREFSNTYLTDFGSDLRLSKLVSAIDGTDTSIISNQTDIRAVYKITPTKGSSTRVNFSFENAIYRPFSTPYAVNETEVIRSSLFTYYRDGTYYDARLTDDGEGNLRIYYLTADTRQIILESNVGSVNYDTGELTFDINAWDYTNNIDIYATLSSDDIIVQNNKYLVIDFDKVYVSVNIYRQ